jgi:hypothetical protein
VKLAAILKANIPMPPAIGLQRLAWLVLPAAFGVPEQGTTPRSSRAKVLRLTPHNRLNSAPESCSNSVYGIVTPPCLDACLHPIVQLGNRKLAHYLAIHAGGLLNFWRCTLWGWNE